MAKTAVVVRVPEAEPVIGRHRRAHTPSGADGMPAHVTVLVPFADSALLVAGMVRELRETLVDAHRFGSRSSGSLDSQGRPACCTELPSRSLRWSLDRALA
jgi:hypothetical protein